MIAVIQCAAKKRTEAGHLRTRDGRKLLFVAAPDQAPPSEAVQYAHPDGPSDTEGTWRDVLQGYNAEPGTNRLGLCRAVDLYLNPAYARIAERFGMDKTFILSAGWGLIGAGFLTPNYDITFSMTAEAYKRRRKSDVYRDLVMLPKDTEEPIVFFGGKDYVPLFQALTQSAKGQRTVFYNSDTPPAAKGCSLVRFQTTTRTNWHYECVNHFLSGNITIA